MPYIATDLDAFDAAQGVSGATGLPLQHVLGGLALLWRWCWRGKTDAVTVDQLAAHFGSTAPGLPSALVAFEFLEARRDGTYRVRGAGRYLHITAVRTEAGKKRAAAPRDQRGRLQRSSKSPAHAGDATSTGPAPDQHVTSPSATSDERRATSEQTDLPRAPPAGPRVKKDTAGKKHDGDPREGGDATYKALVAALFVLFRQHRGADYDPSGRDWKALADLRGRHEGAEIIRRWGIGLQAAYKARCDTFWDLRERWNALTAPEASGGAQGRRPDPNQGITTHEGTDAEMWEAYRENRKAEGLDE